MRVTELQAKLLAVNTLNKDAAIILKHELEFIKSLIGTNPLKVDGSFKAKVTHKKIEIKKEKFNAFGFDWWKDTSYWLQKSGSHFVAQIKTCVSGGGSDRNNISSYCIYESKALYLCEIDNAGLFKELSYPEWNTIEPTYNEEDLLNTAKEIQELASKYNNALKKMPSQFMYALNIQRLTR